MSKYLVIVESPTKAKTISAIMGNDYEVVSSMGHLVDLPSNKLSVDVKNDFAPAYQVIPGREKIISQLKKKSKNKKIIYLATDPDREGEAISWHIKTELSKGNNKFRRIIFHEITEDALRAAFKKHTHLDINKVNSQIARRVLDRVVGYSLSPLLWKKIVRGLSAGRVQSITLRFIVEREKETLEFKPLTTFSISAQAKANEQAFKATLNKYKGKKAVFNKKETALECIEEIKEQKFHIKDIIKKETKRKPPPPFITSSLQQDAFNRLRFSAQKTMLIAQKLYEGIQIGDKPVGLITYMRTDSFHISPKAKKETKEFVRAQFGENYLAEREYQYQKKKGAQLAHEAIRPTSIYRTPQDVASSLSTDEAILYELIWKRFAATFMKEALFENTKALIASQLCEFQALGRKVIFAGYLKVFNENLEENPLPGLEKGQEVILGNFEAIEHITKPPPRFNDASLVKLLEEKGIGRPSTYAPTIYTLIKRNYMKREKRYFLPTDLGLKVNELLVEYFPQIMDENFTALMEEKFDKVEKGSVLWQKILQDFYPSFNEKVEKALLLVKKEIEFYPGKTCPKCEGKMVIKWSRRGRFLSCEHFPKCRYAESLGSGVNCPGCKEGELIERRNRRGQNFYGCSKFPECTYTSRELPDDETI